MQGCEDCDRMVMAQCGACRRDHVACSVGSKGLNMRPKVGVKAPWWAGIEEAIRVADGVRSHEVRTMHHLLREMRDKLYAMGLALVNQAGPVARRAGQMPEAGAGAGRRVERVPEGVAGPTPRTQARRTQRAAGDCDAVEEMEEHVRKKRKGVLKSPEEINEVLILIFSFL
jgi:hypothetical protein